MEEIEKEDTWDIYKACTSNIVKVYHKSCMPM
jgi:hypothetical protein